MTGTAVHSHPGFHGDDDDGGGTSSGNLFVCDALLISS